MPTSRATFRSPKHHEADTQVDQDDGEFGIEPYAAFAPYDFPAEPPITTEGASTVCSPDFLPRESRNTSSPSYSHQSYADAYTTDRDGGGGSPAACERTFFRGRWLEIACNPGKSASLSVLNADKLECAWLMRIQLPRDTPMWSCATDVMGESAGDPSSTAAQPLQPACQRCTWVPASHAAVMVQLYNSYFEKKAGIPSNGASTQGAVDATLRTYKKKAGPPGGYVTQLADLKPTGDGSPASVSLGANGYQFVLLCGLERGAPVTPVTKLPRLSEWGSDYCGTCLKLPPFSVPSHTPMPDVEEAPPGAVALLLEAAVVFVARGPRTHNGELSRRLDAAQTTANSRGKRPRSQISQSEPAHAEAAGADAFHSCPIVEPPPLEGVLDDAHGVAGMPTLPPAAHPLHRRMFARADSGNTDVPTLAQFQESTTIPLPEESVSNVAPMTALAYATVLPTAPTCSDPQPPDPAYAPMWEAFAPGPYTAAPAGEGTPCFQMIIDRLQRNESCEIIVDSRMQFMQQAEGAQPPEYVSIPTHWIKRVVQMTDSGPCLDASL